MTELQSNPLEYSFGAQKLKGFLAQPKTPVARAGVVLLHDAFGVGDFVREQALRLGAEGYAVLAADLWGDGRQLRAEAEIGPTIGRLASDRVQWMGRIRAAVETLAQHADLEVARIALAGYCFGGASALEFLRTQRDVAGVVSLHGGLDLVGQDWRAARTSSRALVLTGAQDPMASESSLAFLQRGLTQSGVDWEVNLYGHVRHGFTRPDADRANQPQAIAYSEPAARRAWLAMNRFLQETLA
ncbi:MAG: dienelactone hydrolase family protein [Comamonas sp.]